MIGLIAPMLLAALVAFALGGSARGWSEQHVRWSPLATAALLAQVALFFPPLDQQQWVLTWGPWLWVTSMVGVLAMLLRNTFTGRVRLRWAWTVAALGVAANVLVVTVNGGAMPRTIPLQTDQRDDANHLSNVVVESTAPLIWLGDVISEPDWLPLTNAVSIGDVMLSLAVAGWVFLAALETRTRRHKPARKPAHCGVPSG